MPDNIVYLRRRVSTLAIDLEIVIAATRSGLVSQFACRRDVHSYPRGGHFTDPRRPTGAHRQHPPGTRIAIRLDDKNGWKSRWQHHTFAAASICRCTIKTSNPVILTSVLDLGKNTISITLSNPDHSYLYLHVGSGFGSRQAAKQEIVGSALPAQCPPATSYTHHEYPEPFLYINSNFDVHYNGELDILRQVDRPTALRFPARCPSLRSTRRPHVYGSLDGPGAESAWNQQRLLH